MAGRTDRLCGAAGYMLQGALLLGLCAAGHMPVRAAPLQTHTVQHQQAGITRSPASPLVAFALHGDIYTIPAAGGTPHRLTAYGLTSAPVLSPNDRLIAYLSAPKRFVDTLGNARTHNVWVVPVDGKPDGSDAYRITATTADVDRASIAWSPDGQRLAYYEGNSVVVSDYRGGHRRVVLRFSRPFGQYASPIAWSPDSRRLAIAASGIGRVWPQILPIAVADLDRGTSATATVRFPAGSFSSSPRSPGSFPDGNALSWSPDGRFLVFATLARGEGPPDVTALWRVVPTGGMASLFIGTMRGVRNGGYPAGTPLGGATHFLFSPDVTRLIADPLARAGSEEAHFWVARSDGTGGRFRGIGPDERQGCVLAQYTWLPGSTDIAYVTRCLRTNTNSSAIIRTTLYSLALDTGQRRALLHVEDTRQDVLQLTPEAGRCVACVY